MNIWKQGRIPTFSENIILILIRKGACLPLKKKKKRNKRYANNCMMTLTPFFQSLESKFLLRNFSKQSVFHFATCLEHAKNRLCWALKRFHGDIKKARHKGHKVQVRKCCCTAGTSTRCPIWMGALSAAGIWLSAPDCWMLYHSKMPLILSRRRAQQLESSWNIYLSGRSSSYHSGGLGVGKGMCWKGLLTAWRPYGSLLAMCQRLAQLNQTVTEKCMDPDVLIHARQQNPFRLK